MAHDTKNNTSHKPDSAEKALLGMFEDVAGDNLKGVPKEGKDFLNNALGVLARWVAGLAGDGSSALANKIIKSRGIEGNKAVAIANASNMVGRSLITTVLPKAKSAYTLVTDALARKRQIASDFSKVDASLEVISFEKKLNSEVTGLKTKSFFVDLFKKAIPDVALNAVSMSVDGVKEYSEYKSLSERRNDTGHDALTRIERQTLAKIEKSRAQNQALTEYKDKAASKVVDFLETKGGSIVPTIDGLPEDSLLNDFVGKMPGMSDMTLKNGIGRANFLKNMINLVGLGYESFAPSFLKNMFKDTATPKASKMLAHVTAAKMIKSLEAPFKDHASPSRVTLPGASEKNCLVGDYVYDIFMRHRADMGLAELSELNKERLREACDVIAAAMQDGNRRLHPQALAYLVDSKRGIITQAAGKGGDVKQGEDLEKMIQSLISDKKLTGKPAVKAEEYYQSEGRGGGGMVRFTRAEMLESWNNLSDEQQQIWSTNFPDAVLEDITGNKDYARSLRMKHNDCWQEMFEEATLAIHNLSQRELQQAGITAGMQKELSELNRELKRDTKNALYDNQARVMDLTAEICVRMDTANSGFLTEMIDNAMARKAKKEGFGHELDSHVEESYHFRNKVGERSREEREHASKEPREPREPRDHIKEKLAHKKSRYSHDEVGEEANYHGR